MLYGDWSVEMLFCNYLKNITKSHVPVCLDFKKWLMRCLLRNCTFCQLNLWNSNKRATALILCLRNFRSMTCYVKSFLRRGRALAGMGNVRQASTEFQEGLKLDPFNIELRQGLQHSTNRILGDILAGWETLVLSVHGELKQHSVVSLIKANDYKSIRRACNDLSEFCILESMNDYLHENRGINLMIPTIYP